MSRPASDRKRPQLGTVWIVNHYADAPDRPMGTRHFDLARQLVRHGYDVTVFASSFSHVTGREERLGGLRLLRTQMFDGVRFVWLRTFPYRGNTWRRQVNMLSYAALLLIAQGRFRAPDTIIGSTVHPFAAGAGWIVARLRGARFMFEVRDLWPQTLVDLGAMRVGSPGERLLRSLEGFLVRRSSRVITLLPGMGDYLREQGLPTRHLVYIPNGVDVRTFDAAPVSGAESSAAVGAALATAGRIRDEGRFVIGYVGAFGRVNKVNVIIEAARIAEARSPGRIGVVLVGDGPERSQLEHQAESNRAVTFGPAVPKRHVPSLLRALDAAVVHATATPVYRYGISFNKLFEYMAAALPVVFACTSAYDPVAENGAGISVPPDDPEVLAEALLSLAARTPEARAQMGAAGRAYVVREHNIERLGETLAELLQPQVEPHVVTAA